MIVLSLCDRTGAMVEPWLAAGYECWIVDLQHERGVHRDGNLVRVGADVSTWLPPRADYRIAFAFPPCTHLAVSGARWFGDKGLPALIESLTLVEVCRSRLEWAGAPWMLENPVGTLSTYWRKPDHSFDPCDFGGWVDGDAYAKKTCIWHSPDFQWPLPRPVHPSEGSKMHLMGPSEERANLRSQTPVGFARAVFMANERDPERRARAIRSWRT